jgi:hypothetical protein
MVARLGFSIAAHLDPDVLVVDEVLSVGDVEFQQRAFQRLEHLVKSGIPVVIVSHQLERVAQLCTRCIQLEQGRVVYDGLPAACIAAYLAGVTRQANETAGGSPITVDSINVVGPREVKSGQDAVLRVIGKRMRIETGGPSELGLRVRSAHDGGAVFATTTRLCGTTLPSSGRFELLIQLAMNVAAGVYSFEPYVWSFEAGREVYTGPTTHVQVLQDRRFVGKVQLNPRMVVRSESVASSTDDALGPSGSPLVDGAQGSAASEVPDV